MAAATFTFDEATHTYTQNGVVIPSVTQILKLAGLVDYSNVDPTVLARKAAIGTEVHRATQLLDEGARLTDLELDPAVLPYVEAFEQFRQCEKYMPIQIEMSCVVEQCGMAYGMTLDRICNIDRVPTVLDIKCSAQANDVCWPIQLAAYNYGWAGNAALNRVILWLRPQLKTKKYRIIEYDDPKHDAVWLSALTLAHYKLANGAKPDAENAE